MPFIYFESGTGSAFKSVFRNTVFTISLKNKWGLSFSQRDITVSSNELPPDYTTGWCFFGDCTPHDNMKTNSVYLQRIFLSKKAKLRYSLGAGVGKLNYEKIYFTKAPESNSWLNFSSNYNKYSSFNSAIGFTAITSVEIPYSIVAGLKLSTFVFIAPSTSYSHTGVQLDFSFGYVREKLRKKVKKIN